MTTKRGRHEFEDGTGIAPFRSALSGRLDDSEEQSAGTNAFLADTDYDYLGDAKEVNEVGTDPTVRDTDGDYLLDGQEGDVAVTTNGQPGGMDYANPLVADTDGDGVSDFAELGGSPNKYGVYELDSSPTEVDTDADHLTDYEETVTLDSDPMDSNVDDDTFIDGRDPNIWTEDDPPEVETFRSENYRKRIVVTVSDRTDVSFEANAYFGSVDDSFWSTNATRVTHLGGDRYQIQFNPHGWLNEPPDKYWINVTDANGNGRTMLIKARKGGGDLMKAGATGIAALGTPTGEEAVPPIAIGVGIVTLGFIAVGSYQSEYTSDNGEILQDEPLTGTARSYSPSSSELPSEVVLPGGAYVTERGVERGYGWEYIDETTGLTQDEIGQILDEGRVVRDEDIRYVIDELASGKEAILTIIGGTLMAANQYSTTNDEECGEEIHYNREMLEDHVADTDKKAIDKISDIIDAVRNPLQIWKSNKYRYYLAKIEGKGYYIVKVGTENPWVDLFINTVLMDDGGFFTKDDAIDHLENDRPDDPDKLWDEDDDQPC